MIQSLHLRVAPVGMPSRPFPEGHDSSRRDWVVDQPLLNGVNTKIRRIEALMQGHGCGQTGRLTNVENQRLKPCRTIGHVADAETFVSRQQIGDAVAQQGLKGDAERCTRPATTPSTAFGGQRPVIAWIMMIIGIGADGDALCIQGCATCTISHRQQIQFRDSRSSSKPATFSPVRHQCQRRVD